MKLVPAVFFIAVGIWATFTYPELAQQAYNYILLAIDWAAQTINDLQND